LNVQTEPPVLQAGFRVDLGRGWGGHHKAAAAVDFLHADGGSRWLVSGGEDGCVLLWDWQVALQQAAAAGDCTGRQGTQQQQQQQQQQASTCSTDTTQGTATQGHQGSTPAQLAGAGLNLQQLSLSGPGSSSSSSSGSSSKGQQQQPPDTIVEECAPRPCRLRLVNKHKVNAVCSTSVDQVCFAWCDTSRTVKLYNVRSA
jgi:hypothetical protein